MLNISAIEKEAAIYFFKENPQKTKLSRKNLFFWIHYLFEKTNMSYSEICVFLVGSKTNTNLERWRRLQQIYKAEQSYERMYDIGYFDLRRAINQGNRKKEKRNLFTLIMSRQIPLKVHSFIKEPSGDIVALSVRPKNRLRGGDTQVVKYAERLAESGNVPVAYKRIKLIHTELKKLDKTVNYFSDIAKEISEDSQIIPNPGMRHDTLRTRRDKKTLFGSLYITEPWYDSGDFFSAFSLPIETRLILAKNAVLALKRLHDKDWVHCDIKPSNFLFNSKKEVCLTDFIRAKKLPPSGSVRFGRLQGVDVYTAPEAFRSDGTISYSKRTDIFALCLTLIKLLGDLPVGTEPKLFDAARMKIEAFSPKLASVLTKGSSLTPPKSRPSLNTVLDAVTKAIDEYESPSPKKRSGLTPL